MEKKISEILERLGGDSGVSALSQLAKEKANMDHFARPFSSNGILAQLDKPLIHYDYKELNNAYHRINKAIIESSAISPANWAKIMMGNPNTPAYPHTFIPFWDYDINIIERPDPSKLNIRVKKKRKAFNFNN